MIAGIIMGAVGALFAVFTAKHLRPLTAEETSDLPRFLVVLDKVGYWLWLGPWMTFYAILVAVAVAQGLGY